LKHGEKQKRLDWITHDIKVSEQAGGDGVALFVGCSPYYDVLLAEKIGFNPTNEARAAVELLNAVGMRPVVLPDEVCCGGDRIHASDGGAFTELGIRNRDLLKKRGIRTIVTTCDDCRYTLSTRYPGRIPGWDFNVVRLTDYLMTSNGRLAFMPTKETVVIQPPDRYSDPNETNSLKKLLSRVPDLTVLEIEPGHPSTFGGWDQFDNVSKKMETALVTAAESTGAAKFLVPSTRMLVRLLEGRRPGSWEETSIRITGLYSFLASRHAVTQDFAGA
jgi:Fe-S oxidoreductase